MKILAKLSVVLLLLLVAGSAMAQEQLNSSMFKINVEVQPDGKGKVISIANNSDEDVDIVFYDRVAMKKQNILVRHGVGNVPIRLNYFCTNVYVPATQGRNSTVILWASRKLRESQASEPEKAPEPVQTTKEGPKTDSRKSANKESKKAPKPAVKITPEKEPEAESDIDPDAYADTLEVDEAGTLTNGDSGSNDDVTPVKSDTTILWLLGGILLLVFGILVVYLVIRRSGNMQHSAQRKPMQRPVPRPASGNSGHSPGITKVGKTTRVVKPQIIDDVRDNGDFMTIDCRELYDDSAVRIIYVKNTCIMDIYNRYADDLRDASQPKEDGCLVLGRCCEDKESGCFDVTLEYTVMPEDDAQFGEYDLNFGIKARMEATMQLKRLRREKNQEHVLTCWVHSHPGMGVFFSNSDVNVQNAYKDALFPQTLTAFVVDILTPQQELGVFTFRRDGSVNSKAELKKTLSLEEMYKWAVGSSRSSFSADEHYNVLAQAAMLTDSCHGVWLTDSAIIDIGQLVVGAQGGLAGFVHGFAKQRAAQTDYAVAQVATTATVPNHELLGSFVVSTYCSLPTIRKVIAPYADKTRFVMVYTTADEKVTIIPMNGSEPMTDEKYYSEQTLEELKIWTRRRR